MSLLARSLYISLMIICIALSQENKLPFYFTIKERTENLPEFVSPPQVNLYNGDPNFKVGWGIDSPTGLVVMDGEVWVLFNLGNQYGTTVKIARYKGADVEHTVRQPDGTIQVEPGISTHFCGGMWYDHDTGTLYAPLHCEYYRDISPPAGWTRKKTRLATSTDKGLTWKLVGDIITGYMPGENEWLKFSGSYFEAGTGDFDFYADSLGGYFYIYSCNAYAPKNGKMNNFLWYNEVARCAISDKMAPGKWFKFCNGSWDQPGLGGKATRVTMGSHGIYGRIIYSRPLKKYLRIGISLGIADRRFTDTGFSDGSIYVAACDDLANQIWTPKAKLFDIPANDKYGFTVTDGDGKDPFVCDQTLRAYNYWLYNLPSRAVDVRFEQGSTPFAVTPAYGSYAYEPLPESADPVMSRQTRMVGCTSHEIACFGKGWSDLSDPKYYEGRAKANQTAGDGVTFSFSGSDIYWRAAAGPDGGKADVYLDGTWAATVDCYYPEALPFQFAYIKTGLAAKKHTIRVVIRQDHNSASTGTTVRHIAFECSAVSYRASAGFSSVMAKNNWFYEKRDEKGFGPLEFTVAKMVVTDQASGKQKKSYMNYWGDEQEAVVGNQFQIAGRHDAVRTWRAPHRGKIRIEGAAEADKDGPGKGMVQIIKNDRMVWSSLLIEPGKQVSHDLTTKVEKGDSMRFLVQKSSAGKAGTRITWDPIITFLE